MLPITTGSSLLSLQIFILRNKPKSGAVSSIHLLKVMLNLFQHLRYRGYIIRALFCKNNKHRLAINNLYINSNELHTDYKSVRAGKDGESRALPMTDFCSAVLTLSGPVNVDRFQGKTKTCQCACT